MFEKINYLFAISSFLNIIWILTWHYNLIFISVIIIIFLLITLIRITNLTPKLYSLTYSAFSLYTGWISIATIANITILLVKIGLPSYGKLAVILTIIVLLIGLIISCLWILTKKNIEYGIVIIWAYFGILIRHMAEKELNKAYPAIYTTIIISLFVLLLSNLWVIKKLE